jgi:hypothetical protein
MAARILANDDPMPTLDKMNSREMKRYAETIIQLLWDATASEELLTRAARVIDHVADGNYKNDNVRTEMFTRNVLKYAQEVANGVATV